jgi:SAM-dependent methyltransferase
MRSKLTFDKLIKDYQFNTVLDVGGGTGPYRDLFISESKKVYTSDIKESDFEGDFNAYDFGSIKFECVWCVHTLEHQLNVNHFLTKIHSILVEGGVLAISVPPMKHNIVGGHVSLWNAGILLYNLILAGFDCSDAAVRTYGYDVSVIVKKRSILKLPDLKYDHGDIETLSKYFPRDLRANQGFHGQIPAINWD